MTQEYWKELTEKYFEGATSPEEERALRGFLARTDDPAFDEARAVLGYFSAQRSLRAARAGARRLSGLLAAAAALAIAAVLGHALFSREPDTCVMYAYGEETTDTQYVLDDVNNTLTMLFGECQGPDVAAQLNELFN